MANVAATGMMQRLMGQGLITQEEATRAMQDPDKAVRDWQSRFGSRVNAVTEQMIESDPDVSVGQATNIPGIAGPIAIPGTPQAGQAPQAGAQSIYEDLSDDQLGQMAGMGDLDRQMAQAEAEPMWLTAPSPMLFVVLRSLRGRGALRGLVESRPQGVVLSLICSVTEVVATTL